MRLLLVIVCALALAKSACGAEPVYLDEPQYAVAEAASFAEVGAEFAVDLDAEAEAEAEAEADAEFELEAEAEQDAEAEAEAEADEELEEEAEEEADADAEADSEESFLEVSSPIKPGNRYQKVMPLAEVDKTISVTLFPNDLKRAKDALKHMPPPTFQPGPKFRARSSEATGDVVRRVLGEGHESLAVDNKVINSAEDLVHSSKLSMDNLRTELSEYEEFYWANGGASIPTQIMGGSPDGEPVPVALVETGVAAGVAMRMAFMPRVNPDMVPIPARVKDIVDAYYSSDSVMMYRPVPVTYVKTAPGAALAGAAGANATAPAFNVSAGFFSPRVGPTAESQADYLLTRAKNVQQLALGSRALWLANNATKTADERMHQARLEMNKPEEEHRTHGVVDADLKPKIITDMVNGTLVASYVPQ